MARDTVIQLRAATIIYRLYTKVLYGNRLLPGTWSHPLFAGVRECPPWCSIVGATVTVHQFFCILHCRLNIIYFRGMVLLGFICRGFVEL